MYHSTTKYLNGHSDMIGGLAVVRDDGLADRLQFIHNAAGAVAGPFDSWLALRGTKTLHLRMPRHDANGRRVAAWLAERVGERSVYYPGLASHPQHELAVRQMSRLRWHGVRRSRHACAAQRRCSIACVCFRWRSRLAAWRA